MPLSIIRQFNWLDILAIILLIRIGYIAAKTGISVEGFKFLGTTAAVYLALHYYLLLAGFIKKIFSLSQAPIELLELFSLVLLALLGYLALVLVRVLFFRLVKVEVVPNLSRFVGLSLGLIRAALVISLLIFALIVSGNGYFNRSVDKSYLGRKFSVIAPNAYNLMFQSLVSKFNPQEKMNGAALESQEGISKK
jgi:uncharacterized membrane protein required for colicin V production